MSSQKADVDKKLRLNARMSIISAIVILYFQPISVNTSVEKVESGGHIILITPYIVLLVLSLCGINVLKSLLFSTVYAGIIGFIFSDYGLLAFNKSLISGFASMQELVLLSMMTRGLSGFVGNDVRKLIYRFILWLSGRGGKELAQLIIGLVVSIFDIAVAKIAIIMSGDIAKSISERYQIPPHYSATWLDIFSCVMQGLMEHSYYLLEILQRYLVKCRSSCVLLLCLACCFSILHLFQEDR